MTTLINIQSIILDYILNHHWKDHKSYANKISKEIIELQPKSKEELIKIFQRSSPDFFYFNEISKKKFIEHIPIDEIMDELSGIPPHPDQIRVLYLASNPKDTTQLRLDEEIREIDNAVQTGELRSIISLYQAWAVRISDLQNLLLRYNPKIVHFSGHGNRLSQIVLEDTNGDSIAVPPDALSALFNLFKDCIQVVVLNACFSEEQARAISKNIDWVIGMSNEISDEAAISFSTAFYRALSYGKSIREAYEFGINQIALFDLGEEATPKLLKKRI